MKILHLADIHARDKDIDEVEKCLEFVVKLAYREQPDLIINAGDTFDSRSIQLDSLAAKLIFRKFSELADIAPVAVITGTLSHDGAAVEALQYINANYSLWVSKKPEQLYLIDGILIDECAEPPDAVLSMVPQPTKQFFTTNSDIKGSDAEIAQAMGAVFGGFGAGASKYDCPHILVGHFQVGGAMISETQILTGVDIEITKDQIALANADLVCLGHIHKQQQMGDNIFYPGSIYRLNYGELDEKGVYIHEISPKPYLIRSEFHKTPTRKLAQIKKDLTAEGAVDEFTAVLSFTDICLDGEPDDILDCYLKVEIKAYQDEAEKLNKDAITEFYLSAGAKEVDVRIIRVPRENVRSERILKLTTLREKLIEQARLKDEEVPESILAKADILESEEGSTIIAGIAAL